MITKDNTTAFIHTIIIIIAWLSPFWLDWKIIFICLFLYWFQIFIFKGCILTNLQFNKKARHKGEMTMYTYWLEKFGYKVNRKRLRFCSDYIMPSIILIITIIWQLILNMSILIKI